MDATEIAAEITEVLFQARGRRSELASRLPLCAVDAGVPLEVLLRNPVEGERSNRALQETPHLPLGKIVQKLDVVFSRCSWHPWCQPPTLGADRARIGHPSKDLLLTLV